MAVVICALVPEEWGRLQRTEKGREHSKKGDSVSKNMEVRRTWWVGGSIGGSVFLKDEMKQEVAGVSACTVVF